MAIGKGKIQIKTKDGNVVYKILYHVPRAFGTLLSLDFFCAESDGQFRSFTIHGYILTGFETIDFCQNNQQCVQIDLCWSNGLCYLYNKVTVPTLQDPVANKLTTQQEAKLWSLCLGYPGQQQLAVLPNHVKGLPQRITPHEFWVVDKIVKANVHKNNAGNMDRPAACFGEWFSFDFIFTRAISVKYKKQKGLKRIVK